MIMMMAAATPLSPRAMSATYAPSATNADDSLTAVRASWMDSVSMPLSSASL
jgi:hypothetical protein